MGERFQLRISEILQLTPRQIEDVYFYHEEKPVTKENYTHSGEEPVIMAADFDPATATHQERMDFCNTLAPLVGEAKVAKLKEEMIQKYGN